MKTRTALLAAIGCGAAAVALVGADLALNVDAWLEVKGPDGAWTVVSRSAPGRYEPALALPGCGNDFRLVVHNGLPWSDTESIAIQPYGSTGPGPGTIRQAWTLSAGETRPFEFHLNGTRASANDPKGFDGVQVQVGERFLSASVCREGQA